MSFIAALGEQAASGVVGATLGIGTQAITNKMNLKQQAKLDKLALAKNKEALNQLSAKELAMWKATNYAPQIMELEKAGLNPALIYGMSGGGGTTTGGSAGTPSSGNAAAESNPGYIGMGIQAMQNAKITQATVEKLQSETNLNNAQAAKTSGVDTNLGETQIQSLSQGISNAKAQEAFTNIQTELGKVQLKLQNESLKDQLKTIHDAAEKIEAEAKIAKREDKLNEALYDTKIEQARSDLALTAAQAALAKSNVQLNDAQIQGIINKIAQDWKQLDINEKQLIINNSRAMSQNRTESVIRWQNDIQQSTGIKMEAASGLAKSIVTALVGGATAGGLMGGGRTVIQGFGGR